MFCTGGIRCEKASAYMLENGFPEVNHLEGGILKYLETVPPEESLWQGECFVFDERVALGHGVEIGTHSMCGACGYPIPKEGRRAQVPDDIGGMPLANSENRRFVQNLKCWGRIPGRR